MSIDCQLVLTQIMSLLNFFGLVKFEFALNPFNILLVLLGWWYVRHNGRYFANRTELKSSIKDSQTLLKDLEDLARRYWESELPEGVARSKDCIDILIGLTRLEHHLKLLSLRKLDIDSSCLVRDLRSKLTGDHFAQTDKPVLNADHKKMLAISQETNRIYALLDEKFEQKFSSPLPVSLFNRLKSRITGQQKS
ncbi:MULTISPECIES: hypothetical protein [Gammaproteobacteria]|uniref:hypothetical protein n=1 Tax=Gammaproteobacteria TaxID=1236 RepID=UPI001ADC95A9|nr:MULTISPECIES: hypothetical protein [Gammaproteobacteria]MBO9482236.1 hypothetical protein [Salinisphaera sp. G21_0]